MRRLLAWARARGRRVVAGAGLLALALGGALLGVAWSRATLEAPEPTLLLLDRQGRFLAEVGALTSGDAGYWAVEALPDRVVQATLAIEDRRFTTHPGVDPIALGRAALQNLRTGRRVSGASTVPMQLARMQRPGDRTYARKLVEACTALLLVARHGREEVLRHYLRLVPYGNRIHGIGYAARRYLDKPVEDLSWAEVAFLSAIPQAPGRMNPFDPAGRRRAVQRGQRILRLLRSQGLLSREEHELAQRQIVALRIPWPARRPQSALHAVLKLEELLADRERHPALRRRPIVTTTLDLDVQEHAAWVALSSLDQFEGFGAGNVALIVLDRETSDVLAWVGSADYFDDRHAGSIDYCRVPRSPGSALKPLLYARALDRGVIGPATILDDLRVGPDGLANAERRFLGPMLPRKALANSLNVPASEVLRQLGLDDGYGFLGELGLHDGARPASHYGLGLTIGTLPVTLEQLVRATSALACDGRLRDLRFLADAPPDAGSRVLSEDAAREVTLWLSDPLARLPSFPRMGALEYPFPVALKTGTSQGFRDAWTVAWTSRYAVGAWVGHPDVRPMKELTGSRSAAWVVRRVLLHLHGDQRHGLEDVSFPPPRGWRAHRTCALTGALVSEGCDAPVLEWFPRGGEPTDRCAAHVRLAVDARDGSLATPATPLQHVEVRTFVELPARYAAWARAARLLAPPRVENARESFAVRVVSPPDGASLVRDPDLPAALATVALEAEVDPPAPQVVWYVDGDPFEVVDYPYATRWPLSPGRHSFEARVPGARSERVAATVQ